jgi:GNAT superfamily N-acetyltransferase
MNVQRFTNSFKALLTTMRTGKFGALRREFERRFHSKWTHYGLCRDLRRPFEPTAAKIPITVRALQQSDLPYLLSMDAPEISERGPYVRMHRLNFIHARIGTCYVGITEDGIPCYMQWLMGSSQNEAIQAYFKGIFPALASDEALLEYAFTPEAFQGKGIMSYAMARIAEKAAEIGATRVITFVDHQNIPALKGCKRAGFSPYLIRTDQWQFFRRRVEFAPLPPGTPYPFDPDPVAGTSDCLVNGERKRAKATPSPLT